MQNLGFIHYLVSLQYHKNRGDCIYKKKGILKKKSLGFEVLGKKREIKTVVPNYIDKIG